MDGREAAYLRDAGFKEINSGMKDTIDSKSTTPVTLEDFLKLSNGRSQLIVCQPEEKENYEKRARELSKKNVRVNVTDFKALRMLKDEVLIISESDLTRGVDYRSATKVGLDLLITCQQSG